MEKALTEKGLEKYLPYCYMSEGRYKVTFQGPTMVETLIFAWMFDLIFHLENYGLRSI